MQHGYVGSLDAQSGRIQLHYRLAAVGSIYAYDERSEAVFRTEVLSVKAGSRVKSHRFTPRIALTRLDPAERLRIMFVGHPLCAELQLAVLEELRGLDVVTYYKPHPIAGLPAICEGKAWRIIPRRDLFPEVDLLVAYRSTLVTEYEQHGVPAALHALTNDAGSVHSVLAEVRILLDEARTTSH